MKSFIFSMFEQQAELTPDETAVVAGDSTLSYRRLNEQANRIAHWLIAGGIGPESVVGVALDPTTELITCLLGVLKTGAMYLPLDASYPPDRLEYMISQARPGRLLTTHEIARRIE